MIENKVDLNEVYQTISTFAIQAILYEASCYPTPGLVSPVSNGAHTDMNFFTFIDSTAVLSKYFTLFAKEGNNGRNCGEIFNRIRKIGQKAEKEMLIKTNGVNTHKGMLFLMGIACAATSKAIYEKKEFEDIRNMIQIMTTGIVEKELGTLRNKPNLSHGEQIYLKNKEKGVRGEAEAGIPTVFDYSLEFFKKNSDLTMNDRLVHTLIGIMSKCDDSTILYRHKEETLKRVKERASSIMEIGGMRSKSGRKQIDLLCQEFNDNNISPGGSADLLGITVFFYMIEKYVAEAEINALT